ncbi:MAG: hypothetical protein CML76_02005 [Rhodobiaceae bacterium]|nr:hypothetical protein [Rhodobiaceae bacterium]
MVDEHVHIMNMTCIHDLKPNRVVSILEGTVARSYPLSMKFAKKQVDCIPGNCSRGRQWLGYGEGLGSFCYRCDSRTDHPAEERLLFYEE